MDTSTMTNGVVVRIGATEPSGHSTPAANTIRRPDRAAIKDMIPRFQTVVVIVARSVGRHWLSADAHYFQVKV
jgi:hypothetical protein